MLPNMPEAEWPIELTPCAAPADDAADLAAGIVEWLIARQMPSGAIRADSQKESPPNEYAHSFAGLAMGLLAEKQGSQQLWSRAERCVDYTLSLDPRERRKQEFNSLALLMLTRAARASSIAPENLRSKLEGAIGDAAFLYDGRRQVSNNWLVMRAVCFLMRASLTGDQHSKRRGEELLGKVQQWWFDGIFVDFPRNVERAKRDLFRRGVRSYATPLTYHAKMCAMLALAAEFTHPDWLLPYLRDGLLTLVQLMSLQGDCVYYGRSCNSLFGMAAAYFAMQAADRLQLEDMNQQTQSWSIAAGYILATIAKQKEADGHLRLTPALDEAERSGWDVYYHKEVYNAYAAALLLAAPISTADSAAERQSDSVRERHECFIQSYSGLLAVRGGARFFVALSTTGQCVLDGSSLFCDMRYSALQPLLIEMNGVPVVPEPPLWWKGADTKAEAVSPDRCGFTPYITWRGRSYTIRVTDQKRMQCGNDFTTAYGWGTPVALSLPGHGLRAVRRLRGRLTDRGDLAFTPHKLPGVIMFRTVFVFSLKQAVVFIDGFRGTWPNGAAWHGPNARILPGTGQTIRNLLDERPIRATSSVPTSRGAALLYMCDPEQLESPQQGCVSAVACAAEGVNIRVEQQDHYLNVSVDDLSVRMDLRTGFMVTPS
jgi:hypothetical protein